MGQGVGENDAVDTGVRAWARLEDAFAARRYSGSPALLARRTDGTARQLAPGVFHVPATRRPDVLVTAVHATNHHRGAAVKRADRGTGGLALLLAHVAGVGALVVLGGRGDANHDARHPAKTEMLDLGAAHVIDLHGSTAGEIALQIGRGAGPNPPGLLEALTDGGVPATTRTRFAAAGWHRVTRHAQRHGMTAVQVEIAAGYRPPRADESAASGIARVLVGAVDAIPAAVGAP